VAAAAAAAVVVVVVVVVAEVHGQIVFSFLTTIVDLRDET
jgi:hypothetical protein